MGDPGSIPIMAPTLFRDEVVGEEKGVSGVSVLLCESGWFFLCG